MKKYFKDLLRTTSILAIAITFVIGTISVFATFPSSTPTGETAGGLFMNYFNQALVYTGSDTNGVVKKAQGLGLETGNTNILSIIGGNNLNATGNLNVSGNVGIGTTTPAYKLDVNGTIRAGSSAILSTGGAAGYYQDSVNGAYRSIVSSGTTNGYYFQTNSGINTTMYVGLGGTYNGRVGIGTNAPKAKLDIYDGTSSVAMNVRSNSGTAGIELRSNNGGNTYIDFSDNSTEDYGTRIKQMRHPGNSSLGRLDFEGGMVYNFYSYNYDTNGSYVTIGSNGLGGSNMGSIKIGSNFDGGNNYIELMDYSENVIFKNYGNVGIGTSAPTSKLDIYDASASVAMNVKSNAGTAGIELRSNNGGNTYIDFSDNSTEDYGTRIKQMRHPGNSSLGRLDFEGGMVYNFYSYNYATNGSYVTIGSNGLGGSNMGSIKIGSNFDGGNNYIELMDYSENAIFKNYGNVGIGTDAPTHKLHVVGAIKSTGNHVINNVSPTVYFQDTDNRSAMIHNNSNILYVLRGSGINSTTWQLQGSYRPLTINLENNNAQFGGTVYAPGGFVVSSDSKLKKNISKIENSINKIQKINGYNFDWKENGKHDIGVIAQEVEKVFPEIVSESKNAKGESYKAVNYGSLIAPLIEAVKEQQKEIETLREELNKLKSSLFN